ncbi:hypothetical protein TcBrA4_0020570 [Trypanosoma cruzi]|nr:hypothetical protein TcBrA4_0020570 [Trypanosoma cruzi]
MGALRYRVTKLGRVRAQLVRADRQRIASMAYRHDGAASGRSPSFRPGCKARRIPLGSGALRLSRRPPPSFVHQLRVRRHARGHHELMGELILAILLSHSLHLVALAEVRRRQVDIAGAGLKRRLQCGAATLERTPHPR